MNEFDGVERTIIAVLKPLPEQAKKERWENPRWKDEIKSLVCRVVKTVCPDKLVAVYANGCVGANEEQEWLYDLTAVRKAATGNIIQVPRVLECEWDLRKVRIDRDFRKLLVARADHRVMIFQKSRLTEVEGTMNDLLEQVGDFSETRTTDRWLFAGLACDQKPQEWDFRLTLGGRDWVARDRYRADAALWI